MADDKHREAIDILARDVITSRFDAADAKSFAFTDTQGHVYERAREIISTMRQSDVAIEAAVDYLKTRGEDQS